MSTPISFIFPDLVSHCFYPLRINANCNQASKESEEWLLDIINHNEKRRTAFLGLKAGDLSAACYPDADAFHLRVIIDFTNYLFCLDDLSDDFDLEGTTSMHECCMEAMRDPVGYVTDKKAGLLTKSFFARFIESARPGCKARFIHTMDLFFKAVSKQAALRAKNIIPDLETYIAIRRDNSALKPSFQLIEFAARIDLPTEVVEHPIIQSLEEATNDLVTWSNDLFSYNVERSRLDTHNMIHVIMHVQGVDLQQAVDKVGQLCKECIDRFEAERKRVPSWGEAIDRDVAIYIDGLQNWIVGSLHWSFDTERYFGKLGQQIKQDRIVKLLPKNVGNIASP